MTRAICGHGWPSRPTSLAISSSWHVCLSVIAPAAQSFAGAHQSGSSCRGACGGPASCASDGGRVTRHSNGSRQQAVWFSSCCLRPPVAAAVSRSDPCPWARALAAPALPSMFCDKNVLESVWETISPDKAFTIVFVGQAGPRPPPARTIGMQPELAKPPALGHRTRSEPSLSELASSASQSAPEGHCDIGSCSPWMACRDAPNGNRKSELERR